MSPASPVTGPATCTSSRRRAPRARDATPTASAWPSSSPGAATPSTYAHRQQSRCFRHGPSQPSAVSGPDAGAEPDGVVEIAGTYLAQWRKLDSVWLIQAEVFVTDVVPRLPLLRGSSLVRRLRTLLKWLVVTAAVLAVAAYVPSSSGPPSVAGPKARASTEMRASRPVQRRTVREHAAAEHRFFDPAHAAALPPGLRANATFPIPVVSMPPERLQITAPPGLRAFWFGHATVLVGDRRPPGADRSRALRPRLARADRAVALPSHRRSPWPNSPASTRSSSPTITTTTSTWPRCSTWPNAARTSTPGLGIGAHLERWAVPAAQIHEMDWWDTASLSGLTITCTPSRHYSGRRWMDNSTLWSCVDCCAAPAARSTSAAIPATARTLPNARRLGAVDLDPMKIGAYGETWLDIHMDPGIGGTGPSGPERSAAPARALGDFRPLVPPVGGTDGRAR